jgi:hypothetical protein
MKRLFVLTPIFLLATFSVSSMALDTDVSGDWEITASTQRGEMTWDASIEQDGSSLMVTMSGPRGGEVTGEGTITGNEIEWTTTRTTQRGEMTMTWTGTVEGSTMSGEVEFGSFGSASWTGTKKTA